MQLNTQQKYFTCTQRSPQCRKKYSMNCEQPTKGWYLAVKRKTRETRIKCRRLVKSAEFWIPRVWSEEALDFYSVGDEERKEVLPNESPSIKIIRKCNVCSSHDTRSTDNDEPFWSTGPTKITQIFVLWNLTRVHGRFVMLCHFTDIS